MTVIKQSAGKILPVILTALLSCGAVAQDDATATADKAVDTAADAQATAEQAQKTADESAKKVDESAAEAQQAADDAKATAEQAQKTADETAQQVTDTATDVKEAQKDTAADVQKQLDAQAALIAAQAASGTSANATLADLQKALNEQKKLIEAQKQQIEQQQAQLQTTTELLTSMQSQIDQLKQDDHGEMSEEEIAMRNRLAALESQVGKIPDDPSAMLIDEDFPGAIRVPGTTAAYKIGGFVKATLVNNFDPLVTQDRFIVGSIPVTADDQTALASETSLTANQSRVNFDYRRKGDSDTLRAFVEADFFGSGDTFRLRHAFGQYRDLLAGKTWSAFYDAEASPEEVDFEGINGHVVVRQTQLRYFPKIGKDWRLMVSLEDPNPEVTGGQGVSNFPDIVASMRRTWFGGWHVKSALLLRQIRAAPDAGVDSNGQPCDPPAIPTPGNDCVAINSDGSTQKDNGWAITASGKVQVPWWNKNDNFLFQLNYGEGLGRYLTDLSSIASLGIDGGQDGVINPADGSLKALPIFGGYIAFQHWWSTRLRSTFIASLVNIDNFDYQSPSSYHQTQRASANLLWSPVSSMDLGVEYLWGKRTNKQADVVSGLTSGTATQLQFEAKYRF